MTSAPGDASRLTRLVDAFGALRVAVVGDIIADEFIYGRLSRISREAPVLILNYDRTTVVPGGAGNAARNVGALGGAAQLVGLVGRGAVDRRLARSLGARVDRTRLLRPAGYRAPVKTRILAGGLHGARQQIVRVDREATPVAEVSVPAGVRARRGACGRPMRCRPPVRLRIGSGESDNRAQVGARRVA